MSNSPNLGLNLQVTGTNNGTWGITLNANQSIIDNRLGARLSKDVAGNSNITVSSTEAQNFFMTLTGALTGNIKYILPAAGGFYFIKNSTSGAFTLTVVNDVGGTGIVIDQGNASFLVSNPDTTTVSTIIPSTLASLSVAALTVTSTISLPAGAIGTAALADNSVTLAKLATQAADTVLANATSGSAVPTAVALSASQLLGKGSSGNIAAITLGTNLSMSGTTLNSAGGGAYTYTVIATSTPGSVATVDFTSIPATYKALFAVWSGVSCDTSSRQFKVTSNCGAGFGSEKNGYIDYDGGSITGQDNNVQMNIGAALASSASVSGSLWIPNYTSSGYKDYSIGQLSSTSVGMTSIGKIQATGSVQGLRFYWNSSGNFDAGTITLYGVS